MLQRILEVQCIDDKNERRDMENVTEDQAKLVGTHHD